MTDTGPAAGPAGRPRSPIRKHFGRRKFDEQPTQQTPVLIATNGLPVPAAVLSRAKSLGEGAPVAVVTIARIYGSSLGLPNPGLMPTKKEMAEQREIVERALGALERKGVESWGQVAASRRPAKTIAEVATARGAKHVLVVRPEQSQLRKVVEGDLANEVSRKLGPNVCVEGVSP
jgi:Universal stress protein family